MMNLSDNPAAAKLRADGYEMIHEIPGRVCIFAHPGRPDDVAELRPLDAAARAWNDLCAAHRGNPLFPDIHEQIEIDGVPPLMLTLRESLLLPGTLDRNLHAPVIGMGRALGLLLSGDDDHAAVHRRMLAKPHIAIAMQAIASAMVDRMHDDEALVYDHGMDEALTCHTVLFRAQPGKGMQPVFTNPFRAVTIHDPARRAAIIRDAAAMLTRVQPPQPPAPQAAARPAP